MPASASSPAAASSSSATACGRTPSAIDAAADVAARLLGDQPAGFTVGAFREAAGITRKHAVPLLAELDARGVTRRRDDLRIAGNRLPAV